VDSDVWLPIATLVLGAALAFVAQSRLADKQHARDLEREEREIQRDLQNERNNRHRQSMLQLMDEVNTLWLATTSIHDAQIERFRATGEWEVASDREFAETMEGPLIQSRTLAELVDDRGIRELASKTIDELWTCVLVGQDSADNHYYDGMSLHTDLMKRLGEYVRSL
jgi:hypothetical protein